MEKRTPPWMRSPVLSALVVNQMPASYKNRMHEYPNKGCIRMAGLQMNRRGQIEETLTVMGGAEGREVIVLAGQQIMAKG